MTILQSKRDQHETTGITTSTSTINTNKKPKLSMVSLPEQVAPEQVAPYQVAPSLLPRSVAMRQALENPFTKWTQVPDIYRKDKDFIVEFIRHACMLPDKANFERVMPQPIRMSKEVTLAFVLRHDFLELYKDRQLYLPHNLANDREVVLHYVQKIPRALQMADSEICDDREVVLAAVNRDGMEILYASCQLKADEEIIRAACRNNGQAIKVCTNSETLQKLLHDRDFLLTTFRSGGGAGMQLVVDDQLVHDEELWLEAIVNGLAVRHLPKAISCVSFWLHVLSLKSNLYYELPSEFQDNPDIARATILASDVSSPLLDHLYLKMPDIFTGSREIALAVAQKARFAKNYLQKYPYLFHDPEIMCHAVFNNPILYFDVAEPLSLQIPIISSALTKQQAHRVLEKLGMEWLVNHEDICIEAVRITGFLMETANAIPDQLWRSSRQLALQWLKRGCRVLSIFESYLQGDRELALAVAEYVHRDYMKIGETLREDHEFIKEAVSLNGRNLIHVNNPSMELVVMATGTYPEASANHPGLSAHVIEKLALYDVFRGEFLRGIKLPTSTLHQLNVDAETSTALKETIAKFLDVPTGKLLTLYRRCQSSLLSIMNNGPPHCGTVNNNTQNPPDLPINFLGLRVSLRGGNPMANALLDVHRAAHMMFDDGIPFRMLRLEQQRLAHDQNRIAQLMRMEQELVDLHRAQAWDHGNHIPPAAFDDLEPVIARNAMLRMAFRRAARRRDIGQEPTDQNRDEVAMRRMAAILMEDML